MSTTSCSARGSNGQVFLTRARIHVISVTELQIEVYEGEERRGICITGLFLHMTVFVSLDEFVILLVR